MDKHLQQTPIRLDALPEVGIALQMMLGERTGKATSTGTLFKRFLPGVCSWADNPEVQRGPFSNTAFTPGRPCSTQSRDGKRFVVWINSLQTTVQSCPIPLGASYSERLEEQSGAVSLLQEWGVVCVFLKRACALLLLLQAVPPCPG